MNSEARGISTNTKKWTLHMVLFVMGAICLKNACSQNAGRHNRKLKDGELAGFTNETEVDFSTGDILAEIPHWNKKRTSRPTTHEVPNHLSGKDYSKLATSNGRFETSEGMISKRSTTVGRQSVARLLGFTTTKRQTVDVDTTTEYASTESDRDSFIDADGEEKMIGIKIADVNMHDLTPPHITWPVNQEEINVQWGNYHVQCTADGNPMPTFTWYRNNVPVSDRGLLVKAFNNGSLVFAGINSDANGYFQCTAQNMHGKSLSSMVLIRSVKEPESMQTESITVTIREWDPAEFKCVQTPPTVPAYIKRWYEHIGTIQVATDERVGLDEEGTIRFAYVQRSDSLRYVCGLTPESSGKLIRLYNEVELSVVQHQSEVMSQPRLAHATGNVKALIGKTVIMECFFSGYPAPSVEWRNNTNSPVDRYDSRYSLLDYGRKLVINRVQENDEGTFKCIGSNGIGTSEGNIAINVTSPPLHVDNEGLDVLTLPDQHDVTLKCKTKSARGEALDVPRWYRNGDIINAASLPYKERYSFNADRTELHISNLDKGKDTACYQCNVSNSEGHLFMDGYLRVINSIQITKRPADVIIIEQNATYDLSIAATGDPCCPIRKFWHFNGSLIESDKLQTPPFVYEDQTDTLILDASLVPESELINSFGLYRCQVTNTIQTVDVYFKLSSAEAVQKVAVKTGGFKLWWVILLCAVVAVLVAVGVVIFFMKSNYPRSTYKLEKTELQHHLNPEEDLLNQSFQDI